MYHALFLGSIGTLVETTDMQRRAFNAAFDKAGLDWHWSEDDYLPMLRQSGGRARIERFANERGHTVDSTALHRSKVTHFAQMMQAEGLDLRPGVRDVLDAAKASSMTIGFVTGTGAEQSQAIFDAVGGALLRDEFDYIGDASRVQNGKPAPDIFLDALKTLGVSATDAISIEDTPVCAAASVAAGIETVGFPNAGVGDTPFPDGVSVVTHLSPTLLQRQPSAA